MRPTLFLTRRRATEAAFAALTRVREALDAAVRPAFERNPDGTVDHGFRVVLLDAFRNPIATL